MSKSMKPKIIEDSKGYSCGRCRQRFPQLTTINVTDFQCPACYRVSTTSPDRKMERSLNSNFKEHGGRVAHIVGKIKNKCSVHHQQQQDSSDSDKPKSLNGNPSPLAAKPPSSASRTPRKRALLIGVTYTQRKYRLKGTVNDVKNTRKLLIETYHFQMENILVLTEEETEAELTPTKKNIQAGLRWLVEDCRAGDSLVFYFSGQALRQQDFDRDERDGFDETICPVDFLEEGMIYDNDINSTIVWPLPKAVTLHAIIDASDSENILDLVYVYNRDKKVWEDDSPLNGTRKHTNGGLAISISGYIDNQMAAYTTAPTGKEMSGARTFTLIEIMKERPALTYADLIDMLHETIDAVNKRAPFKIGKLVQGQLL